MPADSAAPLLLEELDLLRARVSRARRGAIIGGALALVVAAVGLTAATTGDPSNSAPQAFFLVLEAVPIACFGTAIGHLIGGGRLTRVLNDEAGYDLSADRIKRAAQGQPQQLTPAEQARAERYAALAAIVLPAQALRYIPGFPGVVLGQALRLIESATSIDSGTGTLTSAVVGLASALLLTALLPTRLRTIRHVKTYAHQHPSTVNHAHPEGLS